MAGMRAKRKKGGGVTFTFSGDLKECVEKAKQELKTKQESQERVFLMWQKEKAVKSWENYERRIGDLIDFVELGERELKKREDAAGKNDEH